MTKELARPKEDPPIVKALKLYEADLTKALPDHIGPDRFWSMCVNQISQNPQLKNVEPFTFVSSVLLAAQLGLEPGAPLGLAWIIPRRNKGRLEASMQVGYEGWRELAYRSGQVKSIEAFIVYEGDEFEWQRGRGGVDWRHKSLGVPGRDWTDVYAVAETVMGAEMFHAMSKAEVLAWRDRYSKKDGQGRFGKGWREEEDKMGRKTCLIQLCKQLPRSAEVRQAMVADGATPRMLEPDLVGALALEVAEEEGEGVEDEE
jgi:recombination protein RecT